MGATLDLNSLIPAYEFAVPQVGSVTIKLTGEFDRWFDTGEKGLRWKGGSSFVRLLLAENARTKNDEPINSEILSRLSDAELDAAAREFGQQVEPYFKTRAGEKPPHDQASGSRNPDEPWSDYLLSLARDSREYHRKLLEKWSKEIDKMRRLAEPAGGFDRLQSTALEMQKRFNDGLFHSRSELERLAQWPGQIGSVVSGLSSEVQKFQEQARRQFEDPYSPLSQMRELAQFPSQIASGLSGLNSEVLKFQEQARRQFEDPNSPYSQMQRWAQSVEPGFQAFQRDIHSKLNDVNSALTRVQASAAHWPRLGSELTFGGWSESLNKNFGLRLSAAVLAAASSLSGPTPFVPDAVSEAAKLLRPGYHATATAALEGLAAPGASADLLNHYDEPVEDVPFFGDVLGGVRALDQESQSIDKIEALLSRLMVRVEKLEKPRILSILGIAALVGTWAGVMQVYLSWDNASSKDIEKLLAQHERVEKRLAENQAKAAEDQKSLRYVHTRTLLRTGPDTGTPEVRYVFPDQPVRVLNEKGTWVYVEVFDYASNNVITGWLDRRVLKLRPL